MAHRQSSAQRSLLARPPRASDVPRRQVAVRHPAPLDGSDDTRARRDLRAHILPLLPQGLFQQTARVLVDKTLTYISEGLPQDKRAEPWTMIGVAAVDLRAARAIGHSGARVERLRAWGGPGGAPGEVLAPWGGAGRSWGGG